MADSNVKDEIENASEEGFNEQELEDIMNEIESLEQDYSSSDEVASDSPTAQPEEEVVEAKVEAQNPEPVAQEQRREEDGPKTQNAKEDNKYESRNSEVTIDTMTEETMNNNVLSMNTSSAQSHSPQESPTAPIGGHTQMDFHIEGEMSVKLSFTVDGQKVTLNVDKNDGLVLDMESGARFCLPFSDVTKVKKAG